MLAQRRKRKRFLIKSQIYKNSSNHKTVAADIFSVTAEMQGNFEIQWQPKKDSVPVCDCLIFDFNRVVLVPKLVNDVSRTDGYLVKFYWHNNEVNGLIK